MRNASDSQFSDWWAHYPLKKSKGQAEKAYRTARKIVDQETLIAATISYAKLMADKDRQYIAYPATWLNGKKWEDEDIAPADPDSVRTWLKHPVGGPLIREALADAGVDEIVLAPVGFFSLETVVGMAGDRIPAGVIDELVRRTNAG